MDACLMLAQVLLAESSALEMVVDVVFGVLVVCLALGFVIFVHELGHFAVAKMCGVQCDKFFVGFDIGGYKISRKWGETEYGIGILPLGGYVKMLGQDDDPSKIAEQMKESEESAAGLDEDKTKLITGPSGQQYRVDRRSYQAKSVPQRMAIISAGVIMNLIFGFIFAVIAYTAGAEYQPAVVGAVSPGSPAYMAGLQVGDEVVEIDGHKEPSFIRIAQTVTLGDLDKGVDITVRHADTGDLTTRTIKPQLEQKKTRIGIASSRTLQLMKKEATIDGSPAAEAGFKPGDTIAAINGVEVSTDRELQRELIRHKDDPISVTVERTPLTAAPRVPTQ